MGRRIVLDTDIGTDVDDALCLALALATPEIELAAVTHVSGDTRRRAQISRRLLTLAGRADIPVYAGRCEPMGSQNRFLWLGHEGDGILETGCEPPVESEDAVDALARLCRDGQIELVAVGPLTNVAAALENEPDLLRRVPMLTLMGGHVRQATCAGHVLAPGIDYNLCADPTASLCVLSAGGHVRMVPAEITLQTSLREADVAAIEACATPFHRALARAVRIWCPINHLIYEHLGAPLPEDNLAFLHDPLALTCVWEEAFCKFEDLPIEPAVVNGTFRTLEHTAAGRRIFPMRCATAVDAPRFRDYFVDRLRRFQVPS